MAVYNQISCRIILFELNSRFNLVGSDLEIRAIEWIGNALREMNLVPALEICHKDITISNYRGKLPCDVRFIRAFEANGKHFELTDKYNVNRHDPINLEDNAGNIQSYELNKNGYVISTMRTDTVRVHYLKLPTEFDDELQMEIPLIPDDEKVKEALLWNVFYKWLGRGNTHSVYSLGANRPHLDPYLMWIKYKGLGKNSVNRLSKDERNLHKDLWNTLILSKNRSRNIDFLNK